MDFRRLALLMALVALSLLKLSNCSDIAARVEKNCLTEEQDKQLRTSIDYVSAVLKISSDALSEAAKIDKDEATKEKLIKAAAALDSINNDLVSDLVKIVEEACGSCAAIIETISDAVADLEKTIIDIDPALKDDPIYEAVVAALGGIVKVGEDICPSFSLRTGQDYFKDLNNDCLSPKQEEMLETSVEYINMTLGVIDYSLRSIARLQDDNIIKKQMLEASSAVEAIKRDFVSELEILVHESSCGKCADIVRAFEDVVADIEKTLLDINSEWQDDPIYDAVVTALAAVTRIGNDICSEIGTTLNEVHTLQKTESCLSPDEERDLETSVEYIETTLNVAAFALKSYAQIQKDDSLRAKLEKASSAVDAINHDLVSDLSQIVEGTCGKCSDIFKVVEEAESDLERTILDIEPNWETDPLYDAISTALAAINKIGKDVCSMGSMEVEVIPNFQLNQDCLTPEEDEKLKQAVGVLKVVFKVADVALKLAIDLEEDDETRQKLELAAQVVEATSKDILSNLTAIVEEACGSCTEITKAVSDALKSLEAELTDIDPEWRNDSRFATIVNLVTSLLGFAKELCPEQYLAMDNHGKEILQSLSHRLDCMSLKTDILMRIWLKIAEDVVKLTSTMIDFSMKYVTDESVREKLQEASDDLKAIDDDVIRNIAKTVEDFCKESCTSIVDGVRELVDSVEAALSTLVKQWNDSAVYKAITDGIDAILEVVDDLCPIIQPDILVPHKTFLSSLT
mmetsp:Transcript_12366/g.15016  ORF Transcript_12366/g.15016 Transcript_12366/m.15016 type:complete len:742 (+) Transcript_12366:142-2367(+)|eukprot:CAMPEP_0184039174 /NCGR_PEP_ID=MMETSP0955-20130417/51054_1 /TAXON_ID=627963 /ORGANISM="Aplanochytrium sp, Strain PBS07" /LENGTH=741 /DNA_ID=CAMNT_0026328173 /DNA_START=121 /DNA_END=2346 /DNA_ORIENTATION=-